MTTTLIPALIGGNVKELRSRHGLRQGDLADAARARGLPWNASRIGELERGQLGMSLANAIVLCQVLHDLTGDDVFLADLLSGEEDLDLLGTVYPAEVLRAVLSGGSIAALSASESTTNNSHVSAGDLREAYVRVKSAEVLLLDLMDKLETEGNSRG